jgi:hypothetical protein
MKRLCKILAPILAAFLVGLGAARFWASTAPVAARPDNKTAAAKSATNFRTTSAASDHSPNLKGWNPNSALGEIIATANGGERLIAAAALVDSVPVDQLATLINSARACPDAQLRQKVLDMAYAKWAANDPQTALTFARTAATQRFDHDSGPLTQVLSTWAATDPQDALAAAKKINLTSLRGDALNSVLGAMAQGPDPLSAVAAAKALPGGQSPPTPLPRSRPSAKSPTPVCAPMSYTISSSTKATPTPTPRWR